jgi:hypothetical protein
MPFKVRNLLAAVALLCVCAFLAAPGWASSSPASPCPSSADSPSRGQAPRPAAKTAQAESASMGNLVVLPVGASERTACLAPSRGAPFANASTTFRISNTGGSSEMLSRLSLRVARGMKPLVSLKLGRRALSLAVAGSQLQHKPPCTVRRNATEMKIGCRLRKSIRLSRGKSVRLRVRISATTPAAHQYVKLRVASLPVATESSLADNASQAVVNVVPESANITGFGLRQLPDPEHPGESCGIFQLTLRLAEPNPLWFSVPDAGTNDPFAGRHIELIGLHGVALPPDGGFRFDWLPDKLDPGQHVLKTSLCMTDNSTPPRIGVDILAFNAPEQKIQASYDGEFWILEPPAF